MKPTGRINPLTQEEILQAEEQDIEFWNLKWEELSLEQKAIFCSFLGISFVSTKGDLNKIKARYNYFRLKKLSHNT